MIPSWAGFLVCAAGVALAGLRLAWVADALAARHGLPRSLVGMGLVGVVTSLPELTTGIAAMLEDLPDLAVGSVLGSLIFNMVILLVLLISLRFKGGSASEAMLTVPPVSLPGIILINLWVVLVLFWPETHAWSKAWPVLTFPGLVILMGCCGVVVLGGQGEARNAGTSAEIGKEDPDEAPAVSTHGAREPAEWVVFQGLAASVSIVGLGAWLPLWAQQVAALMGWSSTAMGTTFVAITTSLPELASTLGAVRLGAIDLAVGNLLGSNLFNLAILALNDGIQAPPGLWAVIAIEHRYNALVSLLMHAGLWVALSRSGSCARSP